LVGLLHNPISGGLIDRQLIHRSAIGGFEGLLIGDGREGVEIQPLITAQVHRLLGDRLEDLAAGEITQVAGVVVPHQQLRRVLGHLTDARHIGLGGRGGLHHLSPVGAVVIGEILLQGFTPVQLREGDRREHGVAGEAGHLLFHGAIDHIKVGHQGAVAALINDALEEAAHKAGVLGHGVRLLGAFTQLGSQSDGHGGDDSAMRQTIKATSIRTATRVAKGYEASGNRLCRSRQICCS